MRGAGFQALRRIARTGSMLLLLGAGLSDPTRAQTPAQLNDGLYHSETARRSFFDGYAVGTELFCCARTLGQESGPASSGLFGLPLGLRFHLNYALGDQLDLGVVLNASGGTTGRTLAIDWILLKFYQASEKDSYAFRLAVDPAMDGMLGFPQIDVALLTSSLLSPFVVANYAVGLRRVRTGYERWTPLEEPETASDAAFTTADPPPRFEITYQQAFGWELHLLVRYALLLNPARSNVFVSLTGTARYYNLIESARETRTMAEGAGKRSADAAATWERTYTGGIVWVQSGLEYNRPSYQILPFVGLPLLFWSSETEEAAPRVQAGLRLTLR
ncbi:hypothetical protein [Rhodothermus profundi]|uniref:MetA-pathway of phenol degradation n=1 Tax=Rhodothermus profundi TaxID=633813 RepID=A0A1M6RRU9_9BACT|nr:hypothetical protein [Rhodothermus profundi]SHK35037.1 hypothetical protein SAMN04488087_0938 [Rhodothermus profundi]